MNALIVPLLVALSLLLAGCGEKAPVAPETKVPVTRLADESTPETEIPSKLTEGLTPEEKSALTKEILPGASEDGPTREEKFLALKKEAEAGDAKAQNVLGVMYFTGEAISKDASGKVMDNDPATAAAWFHRAALQGYAEAQFNLGLMYANGEGVAQDFAKAVEFFQKAAAQGNADAQNNLGTLYYTGEGLPRDEAKAIEWYKKAAAQGNEDAQANLEAIEQRK